MNDWIIITAVVSVCVTIACLAFSIHAAASLIKCQQEKGKGQ